jgi:DNA mismatch repair protein MutS2
LRHEIEQMLNEKQREADRLIGEARGEFRRAIERLEQEGSGGQAEATQQYAEAKKNLLDLIAGMKSAAGAAPHAQIGVGQIVYHAKSKKSGMVVGLDGDSSKARIMAGNLKLTVDSSELVPESEATSRHKGGARPAGQWSVSTQALESTELNLVGYTVDEAIPLVDQLIDTALIYGYPRLTIVHGLGSGRLKRAIRSHLSESAYVKNFIDGGRDGENGGITIVEL